MKKKVLDFITKNELLNNNDSVVLGVSGGADSICMLKLLYDLKEDLGISLYVVHVNHSIRGAEADEDEEFVVNVCKDMEIPCRVRRVDVESIANSQGLSVEEAGRMVRYDEMEKYAIEVGASRIAVAHNSNDNAETVLMNLARGTGIKGLGGIQAKRSLGYGDESKDKQLEIIRPILCLNRDEIEQYLSDEGLSFRNDSTNDSVDYTRNKIRHEVMPVLSGINDNALNNITNASAELSDIADYLEYHVNKAYDEYVDGDVLSGKAYKLDSIILSGVVRKMIENKAGQLKDITRTHVNDVMALLDKTVGKRVDLPYGLVAEREYVGISLTKGPVNRASDSSRNQKDKVKMVVESDSFDKDSIAELKYTKWLDYDKIDEAVVRTRKKGDYIVVDGEGHTKKLKKYFIDEKIPRRERDDVLLVADGSHVLWVVGHRISEAAKITPETKRILRLEYKDE